MMTQVDLAFRYVRTAHSSGYLEAELATDQIKSLRRKVRMVFNIIIVYSKKIQPGITRDDIQNKTAIATNMIQKLGIPNEAILNRTVSCNIKRITELGL